MPKERIREAGRNGQERKRKRPSLDGRARNSSAQIDGAGGDTLIGTLRRTYGDGFAPGIRGDARLKTLLDRTGNKSLSDYLKATGQSPVRQKDEGGRVGEGAAEIRYASDERFREAHRKTSALHAGLFRRLAE